MRRPLTLLLTVLAVSLMGSDCEYGAAVNNGIAVDDAEGQDGTTTRSQSGLVVVVSSGDFGNGVGNGVGNGIGDGVAVQQVSVIGTALATSLIDLPNSESPGGGSDVPRTSVSTPVSFVEPIANTDTDQASHPVPEPQGLLLFAVGLAAAVGVMQRRVPE